WQNFLPRVSHQVPRSSQDPPGTVQTSKFPVERFRNGKGPLAQNCSQQTGVGRLQPLFHFLGSYTPSRVRLQNQNHTVAQTAEEGGFAVTRGCGSVDYRVVKGLSKFCQSVAQPGTRRSIAILAEKVAPR